MWIGSVQTRINALFFLYLFYMFQAYTIAFLRSMYYMYGTEDMKSFLVRYGSIVLFLFYLEDDLCVSLDRLYVHFLLLRDPSKTIMI